MAAMDGMAGQMVFMVQNMVMMQGISVLFKGFVLVKVRNRERKGRAMLKKRKIACYLV
jgi:hypothetical protein